MSKILLVEDEVLILDTTKELLELVGHQVYAVTTGHAMLAVLDDQGGKIDLVILDLTLPDMNGLDLLPKLTADYPALKVIICSGALPDELEFDDQPIVKGILSKPFELKDLRASIDRALAV